MRVERRRSGLLGGGDDDDGGGIFEADRVRVIVC